MLKKILADPIQRHDGIVNGKSQERKQSRHEQTVNLGPVEKSQEGEQTDRYEYIMRQRYDGDNTEFP